jgi:uncharacterized protein YcbK (DUF882 family)
MTYLISQENHKKGTQMIETIAKERRLFLRAALTGQLISLSEAAFSKAEHVSERSLSLYNQHTDEKLYSVFWYQGAYQKESLQEINRLFRDYRCDAIHPIDTNLLELLYLINQKVDSYKPIEIISAYRSPSTNRALRKHSHHVAKNSYHLKGKAVDIRIANRSSKQIYRATRALKAGGAGYYPHAGFVHIDTGPVRHW